MDQEVARTIRRLGKNVRCAVERKLTPAIPEDLKPHDGRILGFLLKNPEAGSLEIQEHFCLSKSSVSEALSRLIDAGYITYEKSPKDAREKVIRLTKKGNNHEANIGVLFGELDSELTNGLTQEEKETFLRVSKIIMKNAQEVSNENK